MLTLPYSLEASGIPDAHRTSAFGLSHSGAQMGSAAHPSWNPNVPRSGADQRPRWRARHAEAPGHGRSWVSSLALRLPWGGLRRCGDVSCGDHPSSRVPGEGPVAVPRPMQQPARACGPTPQSPCRGLIRKLTFVYQWWNDTGLSAYVACPHHRLIAFVYVRDVLV